MDLSSLDVMGYRDQAVPNTFLTQPAPTRHLGIILPGYRHSVDKPDLYYAGRILMDQGADLLRVEYTYPRTNFMDQPESERDKWISSDALAACTAGLAYRPYEKITLVGKSLGTLAMGHLLLDSRFQKADCVWSTPLLSVDWLCSRIEQICPRSMFIIGTADPFYNPEILDHLQTATRGQSCILTDANHGLEVPGDISKSLVALHQIVEALQAFLNEDTKPIEQTTNPEEIV